MKAARVLSRRLLQGCPVTLHDFQAEVCSIGVYQRQERNNDDKVLLSLVHPDTELDFKYIREVSKQGPDARLLTLKPGHISDAIRCSLSPTDLRDHPQPGSFKATCSSAMFQKILRLIRAFFRSGQCSKVQMRLPYFQKGPDCEATHPVDSYFDTWYPFGGQRRLSALELGNFIGII